MRSVARYPEVRDDGSMWVPLAPPPAPTYKQLANDDIGVIGKSAIVSYSTQWLLDLRILTEPYEEHSERHHWAVQLCDEAAWFELVRHCRRPTHKERIVASVALVFVLENI